MNYFRVIDADGNWMCNVFCDGYENEPGKPKMFFRNGVLGRDIVCGVTSTASVEIIYGKDQEPECVIPFQKDGLWKQVLRFLQRKRDKDENHAGGKP